jgi:hypothetical protein
MGKGLIPRDMVYPLVVFGRPPFETSRILSTQPDGYMAVGPAYPVGLIPALRNRILAAFGFIPKTAPISLTVMPSILPVSA